MKPTRSKVPVQSKAQRVVTAGFGAFLLVLAVTILLVAEAESRAGAIVAALVLGALGVDALASAVRGRASLLSRIGPLP